MTDPNSTALRTALSFHRAWTGGSLDEAVRHLADDVVCDAPAGRLEGVAAYREFLTPFVRMLTGTELIAAFGDDERAIVVYDSATTLVPSGPAAECVTVRNGRIIYNRFIFDRLPFQLARAAAAADPRP
jgi:hypothetical protein